MSRASLLSAIREGKKLKKRSKVLQPPTYPPPPSLSAPAITATMLNTAIEHKKRLSMIKKALTALTLNDKIGGGGGGGKGNSGTSAASFWYCGQCAVINCSEHCSGCKLHVAKAIVAAQVDYHADQLSAEGGAVSGANKKTIASEAAAAAVTSQSPDLPLLEGLHKLELQMKFKEKGTSSWDTTSPIFVWDLHVRSSFSGIETWQEWIDPNCNKTYYFHPPTNTSSWALPGPIAKLFHQYKTYAGARVPIGAIRHKMVQDKLEAFEVLTGLKMIAKVVLKRMEKKMFGADVGKCMSSVFEECCKEKAKKTAKAQLPPKIPKAQPCAKFQLPPKSQLPATKAVVPAFTCPWCTYKNSGKKGPACEVCHRTQASFSDQKRLEAEDKKLSKEVTGDAWDCPKCTWKNEIGSGVCSMCGGEEVWNVSFVPGHEAEKAEAKAGTDGVEVKATTAAAVGSGSADKAASTGTTASTLPMDTSETAAASTGKEEVAETDLLSFSDDGGAKKAAAVPPPTLYKQSSTERAMKSPLLWDDDHAEQAYAKALSRCQFASDTKMHNGGKSVHVFSKNLESAKGKTANKKRMKRIAKELKVLRFNLPLSTSASIFLRYDATRPYLMRALLTGPTDTPYEGGLYCYDIYCSETYPSKPPQVKITTTGGGSVRFNPNLYANGKVCLSLLGTWRGKSANEGWTKKSTMLQVLVSIQSTIMGVKYPYFNEPGRPGYFENGNKEPTGNLAKKARTDPNGGWEKLRVENIKQAMVEQLRHPTQGLEDVIRAHFYLRQKGILKTVEGWLTAANSDKEATAVYITGLATAIKELKVELEKLNKDPPRCCIDAYKELEEDAGYEEAKQNVKESTDSAGIFDTLASLLVGSGPTKARASVGGSSGEKDGKATTEAENTLATAREEERKKRKDAAAKRAKAKQAAIEKMVEELEMEMKD